MIRLRVKTGVNILEPTTFAFLIIGCMIPYWFAALTMKSVGKAAGDMGISNNLPMGQKWGSWIFLTIELRYLLTLKLATLSKREIIGVHQL